MFILKKRGGGQTFMGTEEEKENYDRVQRYIIGLSTALRKRIKSSTDNDLDVKI
jgi:hypothetical protein